MDPLFFKHGFQLVWRIGDIYDAAYMKCMMLTGSNIAGSPGPTEVIAYAWVYTWEEDIATTSSTSLSTPSLSTTIPTTQEPTTISTTQEPTTISTTEELTTIPTTQESTTISTTEESDPPQSTHKASSADKIEINFIGRLWSLLVCLVIMHLRH
uniref:Uncharacterized protein n=1 Tax=Acrobeloides nanus TaxID=290746 RepID=A0A914DU15_9BILA